MRAAGKTIAAVAIAAALLVVGGIGVMRGSPTASGRDAVAMRSASAAHGTATGSSPLLATLGRDASVDDVIASLQAHLREVPDDAKALAELGDAYVTQARVTADPSWYPKAEGVLARSLQLDDRDNEAALLGEGALMLARHDFAGALRVGRRAERLNPYDPDVYGVIGDAELELGHYDEAFHSFQTMVDTKPELSSYARVSYARELLGDVPGAIAAMRMAFDAAGSNSDAAWAAYQLGELEWNRGDVTAAKDWYSRGLQLDERYVPNEAGLAKVAWAKGDTDLAIQRYTDVVARYPAVEYVSALGDLYATLGQEQLAQQQYAVVQATRQLQQANGVNTDLEVALFDADHGEPAAAVRAARAEWERRHSIHVADAYAWALYMDGDPRRAEPFARFALHLGTQNASFFFHAGMIERALGDRAGALRDLRQAVSLNPHFSILHAADAERVLASLDGRG